MVRPNEIRYGEVAVKYLPFTTDAALVYIGCIHTPWIDRLQCPCLGKLDVLRVC
jgi:hypothetical protein